MHTLRSFGSLLFCALLAGTSWARELHSSTCAAQAPAPAAVAAPSFAERWFATGREAELAGKLDQARTAFERVLERDARHLGALAALARLERKAADLAAQDPTQLAQRQAALDRGLAHARHFLDVWRWLEPKPAGMRAVHSELEAFARESDPLHAERERSRREFVSRLLELATRRMDQGAWHSAQALLTEASATDPEHPELAAGLERIRTQGGSELAQADETGGVDPLAGVDPEWVAANDRLHASWETRWEVASPHYKVRTDAGYQLAVSISNAMEQIHGFYRQFHNYKLEGEAIPAIDVDIHQSYEQFKRIGNPPTDWAAGYFNGSAVVTYDPRQDKAGALKDLIQTLFHEASHQFTSLAGGSAVPAWLNEGMASFFEGTELLSNGKVRWNQVAAGRLYPLLEDLRSAKPNHLADVLEGRVDDYRVYYPWGWGIVYYLYNAEDESGRLLYRGLLPEYFQTYNSEDHTGRFGEFFLQRAAVPGVTTLADFEARMSAFHQNLEALDRGTLDAAALFEERGRKQLELKDYGRAIELFEQALERRGSDPRAAPVALELAAALEAAGHKDRAAGALRRWLTLMVGVSGDPEVDGQRTLVLARLERLDDTTRKLENLRERRAQEVLGHARRYRELGLVRLALESLRGPATALPPNAQARALYLEIVEQSAVELESWQLLFDEETLAGFYGGGDQPTFTVDAGRIRARIPGAGAKPAAPRSGEQRAQPRTFAFQRLFIDRRPAGDWSLEAELELSPGCRLAGLCFGKKQDGLFQGIALLPEGYLDLSEFGVDGRTLERRPAALELGWHRLRMDVAGHWLLVFLDGVELLRHEFPSRASLEGDFGLLAGEGTSSFRELRLREWDPALPRRPFAQEPTAEATLEGWPLPARAAAGRASYSGSAPPALRGGTWSAASGASLPWPPAVPVGGELDALLGMPVVLVFWTSYQERQLPLLAGLDQLRPRCEELGIPILLVSNEDAAAVAGLAYPVMSGAGQAFEDYAIAKVGLPHALLIDVDGRVVWDGNPDWSAQHGSYLDEPLANLITRRKVAELRGAELVLEQGELELSRAELGRARQHFQSIADLGVGSAEGDPRVRAARAGLARVSSAGQALVDGVDALESESRFTRALAGLERVEQQLTGWPIAEAAAARKRLLEKQPLCKASKGQLKRLENALKLAEKGRTSQATEDLRELLTSINETGDPDLRTRAEAWARGLEAGRAYGDLLREQPGF